MRHSSHEYYAKELCKGIKIDLPDDPEPNMADFSRPSTRQFFSCSLVSGQKSPLNATVEGRDGLETTGKGSGSFDPSLNFCRHWYVFTAWTTFHPCSGKNKNSSRRKLNHDKACSSLWLGYGSRKEFITDMQTNNLHSNFTSLISKLQIQYYDLETKLYLFCFIY